MARNNYLTFRTHYALAAWNINERLKLEGKNPIHSAITGEKAARRLFSLYIYKRENTKCSQVKKILAQKLLEEFDKKISNTKEDLSRVKKNLKSTVKKNTQNKFIIEKTIGYKLGTQPVQVKINADLTPHVARFVRLYVNLDDIVELVYQKKAIGLVSHDQYRNEIEEYSKPLKNLMNEIIAITRDFFNVE